MSRLTKLKDVLLSWDGQFESAEVLLAQTQSLLVELQQNNLVAEEVADAEIVIQAYQKLVRFLQQEKNKVQREASRMNQSNQKVRDYVRFNQTSGFEFYY